MIEWGPLATILVAVAAIFVSIVLFWLDTRRHLIKIERENAERLTRVETRLEPIWQWWVKEKP